MKNILVAEDDRSLRDGLVQAMSRSGCKVQVAQNGKEELLVRYLFDHRCAICYVDRALAPGQLYDWDLMIEAVEQTAPNCTYGEHPVYLNRSYG